jgi:hypothetical protein
VGFAPAATVWAAVAMHRGLPYLALISLSWLSQSLALERGQPRWLRQRRPTLPLPLPLLTPLRVSLAVRCGCSRRARRAS